MGLLPCQRKPVSVRICLQTPRRGASQKRQLLFTRPAAGCSFPFNDPGWSRCSFCCGRSWVLSNNSAIHFTCVCKLSYFFHWHLKKCTALRHRARYFSLDSGPCGTGRKVPRRPVKDDKSLSCQKDWTPFPRGHRGTVLVSPYLSVGNAHGISGLEFPPPFRLGRFHRQTSRPSCLGGWAHPNSGQGEPDDVWVKCQKVLGEVYLEKYFQIDQMLSGRTL